MREICTSGLMRGYWKRGMGEILWHRRETRRATEKTNVVLNHRASALLYPHREPFYNRDKLVITLLEKAPHGTS